MGRLNHVSNTQERQRKMKVFRTVLTVIALSVASYAGVYITSPANGATVGSPVRVTANATSGAPITYMRIYVDGVSKWAGATSKVDTSIAMANGWRAIVVQAWDSTGHVQKSQVNVNVSGTTSTSPSTTTSGVHISSPANGATAGSPVRVVASAAASKPITAMRVYVDGRDSYAVSGNKVDTSIAMAGGWRQVVVQAWDTGGAVYKQTVSVNVSGTTSSGGSTTTPSGAKVFSNIDQMTGWEHCDVCSGINAAGPRTAYSVTYGVNNPSMDGKSVQFWLGGSTPYASALWWKQLGGNSGVRNFRYDLYFYIQDAKAPQALEFDANQSISPYRYVMGTECSLKTSHQWSVWDGAAKTWRPTGAPCNYIEPYKWHHLVEEFERTPDGKVRYVSITLDGVKHYINRYYSPQYVGGGYDINVAIQLDGNSSMTNYKLWADKITLTYW